MRQTTIATSPILAVALAVTMIAQAQQTPQPPAQTQPTPQAKAEPCNVQVSPPKKMSWFERKLRQEACKHNQNLCDLPGHDDLPQTASNSRSCPATQQAAPAQLSSK